MEQAVATAVVDFTSFTNNYCNDCNKNSSNFIIKELTIVDTQTGSTSWFLFKPPPSLDLSRKRENIWLSNNYIGLSWNDGYVSYKDVNKILHENLNRFSKILVKGIQKVQFLQSRGVIPTIINMDTLNCPSFKNNIFWNKFTKHPCLHHANTISSSLSFICSRDHALKLYQWYKLFHCSDQTRVQFRFDHRRPARDIGVGLETNDIGRADMFPRRVS